MSVAHKNYRTIPADPGLGLHPNQVAEQQRLHELKRTDPGLAQAQIAQASAEEDEPHARPDAGRAEEAVESHAPGRRAAADAGQRDAARARRRQGSRRRRSRRDRPTRRRSRAAAAPERRADMPGAAERRGRDPRATEGEPAWASSPTS